MSKIYHGYCPATAGELIQGFWGEREYLISYCIPLYSHATLEYQGEMQNPLPLFKKAQTIKDITLSYLGVSKEEALQLELKIKRDMPVGKGMSSSTADLGAVMAACFAYTNVPLDPVWMAHAAACVEPTDASYFSECVIFDSVKGEVKKNLGKMEGMKVLLLEPEDSLDTVQWRKTKDYEADKKAWDSAMREIWEGAVQAFAKQDRKALAHFATENSRLNQRLLAKPYLEEILEVALYHGAWGINVAHSGTILAVLMEESLDTSQMIKTLNQHGIFNYYTRQYELPIITGGLPQKGECK